VTPTDLSEMSLELKITSDLTGFTPADVKAAQSVAEAPVAYGAGWVLGDPHDYDRQYVVDTRQLFTFLERTQPEIVAELNIGVPGASRTKFLERIQSEVAKRGVVDVLRKGIKHGPESVTLYFQTPSEGNPTATERFAANIFGVTRQLRYSLDETQRALDLALFINGLPIATLELKNQITNQTVADAISQYKRDRRPKERIFQFGVCAVHFAVDDNEVWFTTRLRGKATQFLPFNKGYNDGAGNPPNSSGIKTDYLWKDVLRRESLAGLIENFITRIEEKDEAGKKQHTLIFPRYPQLDVVRKLLADAQDNGAGRKYLIQHSAGSGKSNSISWLAWQLIELTQGDKALFDTVLIVTDRRALDSQLSKTVKAMGQSGWAMSHADASADLGMLIRKGQRIITTTVQKFPFVADKIGSEHRDRSFAIIIDEAHSSQGGRASAKLNATLAQELDITPDEDGDYSFEDQIILAMKERKMLTNASYFAFTATPKNRTLEMFGERIETEGGPKFRPFHTYTMKQAIDEGFILDVLLSYTPYSSYYKLVKTVQDDPEFDRKRARRKLHHYVESHPDTVRQKAEIVVDHFHTQVIAKGKVGGEARAMVVTSSIRRAIDYWQAILVVLRERKSPYRPIIAFSGEQAVDGKNVTEAQLNGFPSSQIPDRFKEHPYRLLVVADKFQTGFDEPLLHTMYVDKPLSSVKAVQTLSRLNRAYPAKNDTFVLDFFNDPEEIERAFQPFYRTTLLSGESDPNKLHDMQAELDDAGIYAWEQVETFVRQYLEGVDIALLHPSLDASADLYKSDDHLDDEGRIAFKGTAKGFVRTYSFLSAILPYTNAEWEQLSIFLKFLIPKLPAPDDPDLAKGILEAIDMESYRVEAKATMKIALEDADGLIDPPPASEGGFLPEPEIDRLSNILQTFNDLFADAGFTDEDRTKALSNINGPILDSIERDATLEATYQSGDQQNAQIQFNKAFASALGANIQSNLQVYKKQQEDQLFRQHLEALVYELYKNRAQTPERPGII